LSIIIQKISRQRGNSHETGPQRNLRVVGRCRTCSARRPLGAPFMHIMEGGKGEQSRELVVYDLEQRRLIDEQIVRRTIDSRSARSRRAGRSTSMSHSRWSTSRHCRIPGSREAPATGTLRIAWPRWMPTLASCSTRSINFKFATTPSWSSPATTALIPRSRLKGRRVRGVATTSRTWRARSAHHSSSASPAASRPAV
jgi:hypothetical protein